MRILTLENREHELVLSALTTMALSLRTLANGSCPMSLKDRLEWIGVAEDCDALRTKITPPQ